MNQKYPQYVSTTVHKRHYYMVECKGAYEALNEIRTYLRSKK